MQPAIVIDGGFPWEMETGNRRVRRPTAPLIPAPSPQRRGETRKAKCRWTLAPDSAVKTGRSRVPADGPTQTLNSDRTWNCRTRGLLSQSSLPLRKRKPRLTCRWPTDVILSTNCDAFCRRPPPAGDGESAERPTTTLLNETRRHLPPAASSIVFQPTARTKRMPSRPNRREPIRPRERQEQCSPAGNGDR